MIPISDISLKTFESDKKEFLTLKESLKDHEYEKLQSKTLSQLEANQEFDKIIEQSVVLKSTSITNIDYVVIICENIRQGISNLIIYTNKTIHELEIQKENLSQKLLHHVENHTSACKRSKEYELHLKSLQAQLEGSSTSKQEIDQKIPDENKELKKIKKKLKKERKKAKWIVIKNDKKHYKKLKKIKKIELNQLIKKRDDLDVEIQNQKIFIVQINSEIEKIASQISEIDIKIKQLGSQVTDVKNIILALKGLLNDYKFLNWDIDVIKKCIQVGLDGDLMCIFFDRIKKIHVSFLDWNDWNKKNLQ